VSTKADHQNLLFSWVFVHARPRRQQSRNGPSLANPQQRSLALAREVSKALFDDPGELSAQATIPPRFCISFLPLS
jgi:hypothetical protein